MAGLPDVSSQVSLAQEGLFIPDSNSMTLTFISSSNIDDIIEYWRKESYLNNLDHGEDVGTPGKLGNGSIPSIVH